MKERNEKLLEFHLYSLSKCVSKGIKSVRAYSVVIKTFFLSIGDDTYLSSAGFVSILSSEQKKKPTKKNTTVQTVPRQ